MIQSVLFDKRKGWKYHDAIQWIKQHGYHNKKVDETIHYLRFRQKAPKKGNHYRIENLGKSGVRLVLMFSNKEMAGHGFFDVFKKVVGAPLHIINQVGKPFRGIAGQVFNNIPMVKQTGIDVTPYVGVGSDAVDKLFGYGMKKRKQHGDGFLDKLTNNDVFRKFQNRDILGALESVGEKVLPTISKFGSSKLGQALGDQLVKNVKSRLGGRVKRRGRPRKIGKKI